MSNDKLIQGLKALDDTSPFAAAVREIERQNMVLGSITAHNSRLRALISNLQSDGRQRNEQVRDMSQRAQKIVVENHRLLNENESLKRQRDSVIAAAAEKTKTVKQGLTDTEQFIVDVEAALKVLRPRWQ